MLSELSLRLSHLSPPVSPFCLPLHYTSFPRLYLCINVLYRAFSTAYTVTQSDSLVMNVVDSTAQQFIRQFLT